MREEKEKKESSLFVKSWFNSLIIGILTAWGKQACSDTSLIKMLKFFVMLSGSSYVMLLLEMALCVLQSVVARADTYTKYT